MELTKAPTKALNTGLTKREQRNLNHTYGAAQLSAPAYSVLAALINLNRLEQIDDDAEDQPFAVGIVKLRQRSGFKQERTVVKGLKELQEKELVTIQNRTGRASLYQLSLGKLKNGPSVKDIERHKKNAKTVQQTDWQRKLRQDSRKGTEEIRALTLDALVSAAKDRETTVRPDAAIDVGIGTAIIQTLAGLNALARPTDVPTPAPVSTTESVQAFFRNLQKENRVRAEAFSAVSGLAA